MNNSVFIFVLVFSLSALFTSTARAETDTFAKTTANNLNVRGVANGKSVIERLPLGSVVAILETQGAWINILYLEGNDPAKPKEGWVSADYLRVVYKKKAPDSVNTRTAGL